MTYWGKKMSSTEKAIKIVKNALDLLEKELSSPDPKLAYIPRIQKENFKHKLQEMYQNLNMNTVPNKASRNFGLARAIADTWPYDSNLGEEITKAEVAYIEVK